MNLLHKNKFFASKMMMIAFITLKEVIQYR